MELIQASSIPSCTTLQTSTYAEKHSSKLNHKKSLFYRLFLLYCKPIILNCKKIITDDISHK